MSALDALADLVVLATETSRRRHAAPVEYLRWLPLQREFLASSSHCKQIRAGNQTIGKTTPALAEVIGRCVGRHPLGIRSDYRIPPIEAWVICASWSQSLGIQAKLWALLPKDELAERTSYDAVSGFAPTKSPVVQFRNGSIIRIKTTGQDAIDFAGATIDVVLFDEPPKQPRTYVEALMRLEELGGVLLLSYTPINAPTAYLRELCESGQIEDHWRPLTPEELIPVGCVEPLRAKDGRLKDAAWIAERAAKIPEHERGVVLHGEWEQRSIGGVFRGAFVRSRHVSDDVPDGDVTLVAGIDHGEGDFREMFVISAVTPGSLPGTQAVHVLGEYASEGSTTTREDAEGIVALLDELGVEWGDLSHVYGDKPTTGRVGHKSNRELLAALTRIYSRRAGRSVSLRPIWQAKRGPGMGSGSVWRGVQWLQQAMLRGDFRVHSRAQRVIDSLDKWENDNSEWKDAVDALRYATWPYAMRGGGGPAAEIRVR